MGPNGPPFLDHRLHRRRRVRVVLTYLAAGALVSFLIAALHRRCYSKARRQARRARREERRRRRAFKLAAYKHALRSWFARHFSVSYAQDELDREEKRAALATGAEEHDGDVVASEISQLLNATAVVEQILAAEEGRVSVDSRSSLPDYRSELGAGEQLPAYEDNDGSELSLVIADGFMYTPGTSDYTPGISDTGSMSNVLGDTKE
jgi:hypothetical protein